MKSFRYILVGLLCSLLANVYSQCGSGTPSFTANMIGNPNGTYISPSIQRNDTCCGSVAPDVCIKFTIFLDPNAMGINFGIASGAVPPGAIFYQINCGPPIPIGTPICLSGAGPHVLTFCKPGNNQNTYSITSIPKPAVPDSITVSLGCTQTLAVSGFSVPTINWTSVAPGATGAYNGYLSCTSGCATVAVTPTGTPPAFVDYAVSGFGQSPCQANFYQDTVRVYFYGQLLAGINPTLTTICAGSTSALLTATVSGGLAPYTYSWSPGGSSSTSVTVGPGTYTVSIKDNTGCPAITATAVVNQYTLPISANAGPNQLKCISSPTVVLNGTVTNATGGVWSGGGGSFSPATTSLNTNYIPTSGELTSGVQLYLTTTGNSGCPPKMDTINISFQNVPIANAGPNFTVCGNNSVVNLSGSITGFSSTGTWTTSGSGAFANASNPVTSYTPSSGDISSGSVNLILTSTANGVCPPAKDTAKVIITPSPTVNAGTGGSMCSNSSFALNGTVIGGSTTGIWSTSGNGGFSPSASSLAGSYIPGSADIAAGSVTLTLTSTNNGNCIPVQDTIIISIKQLATVSAGTNQAICSSAGSISLSGLIGGGTSTGIWTSSGTGGFSPSNTSVNTSYAITANDITNGSVTFTLSSTNNGACPIVRDTVKISISQLAVVNAGSGQALCSTSPTISLSGSVVSNSNTGVWFSSGPGPFSPSNSSLNTTYSITSTDIATGSVTFTLMSTNNGACPPVTDTVKIILGTLATASVASGPALCSNTPTVALTATVSGITNTGSWSASGGGAFNPSSTSLNPTYFVTATDLANGFITFTISSTNNGPCPVVTAVTSVTIIPLATVNAGANQAICSNQPAISLNGTVTGVSGQGVWSSSGLGSFNPSNTSLSTNYSITPSDITNGSVTFTLSSANNGPCPVVSDTVKIIIGTLATASVASGPTLCSSTGSVALTATVSGVTTSGAWSSSGSGAYNPANTSLNTTYFITPTDIANGFVTFTLTSTNNGPCPATIATASVAITTIASVNAGLNQNLCSSQGSVALSGTVTGVSGQGIWSSSGTGPFNPINTSLSNSYAFTPTDITNGSVTFTLTSTNNGPCPAVTDTVKIAIQSIATVTASSNSAVCSSTGSVALTGNVSGVTSTGVWTSSGAGAYNPGASNLNTSYLFTANDITNGFVTFTLTSTNNGPCAAVSDTAMVNITTLASVNAGVNQNLCSNQGTIALNGTVTGASGQGMWTSSGIGSFNPNNTALANTYSFTSADITNGSVTFTLSSTNNGPCPAVNDTVRIAIKTIASVNAGPNKLICSNTPTVNLSGIINGSTNTGIWSTNGTGAFTPNSSNLNNNYFITVADVSAGTINFTLTSTNNGPCPAVTDTMILTINQLAVVNAGQNQALCSNANNIALNGSVGGGTSSGIWSSSGSGTFSPSNSVLNPNYSITTSDITNGAVTFTLSSTNNGACPSVSDTVRMTIRRLATVNAGANQNLCSTNSFAPVTGTVSGGSTTGIWTTTGTGSFTPNNTSLGANYVLSNSDKSAGTILLILSSTNNGVCPVVADTVAVQITPLPSIAMNSDTMICANNNPFQVKAVLTGGSGALTWTTSGTGNIIFTSNAQVITYSMSPTDISSGFITITFNSINNGGCGNISASMNVTINPAPTAAFIASTYTAQIPNDPILFTNQSVGAVSYSWNFGDGSISLLTNPIHNYPVVGYYDVELVAVNQFGCRDSVTDKITVISDIQFPNVFTPNTGGPNGGSYNPNDYSNDVFFPYTAGVTDYHLRIFNRWGELIFESKDIYTGWDGYFNGKLCQQDAYVWQANVKFFDGRSYNKTGNVTLLR
jgi:gliding motility-associated-like protein